MEKFHFLKKEIGSIRPVQASFEQARALNTESLHPSFGWATRHINDGSRKSADRGRQTMSTCTHLSHIHKVTPHTKGCEECLKMGDTWVHLRLCMECGHVGCCDSSKNKHATKHFHRTKHPIMRSLEPGENWGWCFIDDLELDFS
jgi:uncharacterized UBP type Zn finger protein